MSPDIVSSMVSGYFGILVYGQLHGKSAGSVSIGMGDHFCMSMSSHSLSDETLNRGSRC